MLQNSKKSNIAFLFHKHEAQKVATCAPPIATVDEGLSISVVEDPPIVNGTSAIVVMDEGTCEEQEESFIRETFHSRITKLVFMPSKEKHQLVSFM